jgi:hypothetical protein
MGQPGGADRCCNGGGGVPLAARGDAPAGTGRLGTVAGAAAGSDARYSEAVVLTMVTSSVEVAMEGRGIDRLEGIARSWPRPCEGGVLVGSSGRPSLTRGGSGGGTGLRGEAASGGSASGGSASGGSASGGSAAAARR